MLPSLTLLNALITNRVLKRYYWRKIKPSPQYSHHSQFHSCGITTVLVRITAVTAVFLLFSLQCNSLPSTNQRTVLHGNDGAFHHAKLCADLCNESIVTVQLYSLQVILLLTFRTMLIGLLQNTWSCLGHHSRVSLNIAVQLVIAGMERMDQNILLPANYSNR